MVVCTRYTAQHQALHGAHAQHYTAQPLSTTDAHAPHTLLTIVWQIRLREYQPSQQVSSAHTALAVWLVQPGVTHDQHIRMSGQE